MIVVYHRIVNPTMYQVTATMEDGSKIPYSAMDEFQMCHIYYMLMNKSGVVSIRMRKIVTSHIVSEQTVYPA